MKTFIVTLLTLVVAGAMLVSEPADARRFGGGKSFGRHYSAPARPAQPRQAQPPRQQQAAPGATRRPSGASRWLGPLAGLAAGGLLASLFFGDAFQGFQIMDFLIIALLIFGGVMLFRMLRQKGAGAGRPAHVGAGPGPMPHGGAGYGRGNAGGLFGSGTGAFGSAGGMAGDAVEPGADEAPTWFDAAGFVEGAKTHFIRLQAAWDRSDFADIRDYTSPQMYAELKRERESLGDAPNDTEVVRLDAELLGVQRDGDQVVASVRFSGLIREEATGPANAMDEVWHVAHRWDSPEGDWIIVGIQQTGQ